ncbi:hypothetical protein OG884_12490 [Streptosporangium sp. NBC_01755]|uniref:hypothetical protein n=1 Tax=unclassified Streptosporangium TaxID=2632669 RepID=UPI002DDADEB9|nr:MULTISPECIES: hypothetical protein [unclassified Streptosporangium]WSA25933.1 hypothetical protein OIE13_34385 [Streptosporangium sp. NBC_01810]WSD02678.1 hypothetical protein OG884_12490 [Streptosporangium sp. NBC_01755]
MIQNDGIERAATIETFLIDRHRIESSIAGNGTTKNRLYWQRRGFETRSPCACNTFTAPAVRVT